MRERAGEGEKVSKQQRRRLMTKAKPVAHLGHDSLRLAAAPRMIGVRIIMYAMITATDDRPG